MTVAAISLVTSQLHANDVSWILNRSGSWSANANWLGGAPHADDNATFSSGVGTVDQSFSLNNFTFSGGQIAGGNSISTAGTFTWLGNARLGGSGTLNSNGTLLITGPVQLDGRTLNNAGTAIWSAGDIQPFQFTTPDAINNLAGATFEIAGDHNIFQFNAGATLSFNNAGVLRKDTTGGATQFTSASLFNSGTVDVQTGTLALAGGNSSGTFNIASGARHSHSPITPSTPARISPAAGRFRSAAKARSTRTSRWPISRSPARSRRSAGRDA